MRLRERLVVTAWAMAACATAACAIPFGAQRSGVDGGTNPTPTAGCLLFQEDNPDIGLLNGTGTSLATAGGPVFWTFTGATLSNGMGVTGGLLEQVSGDNAMQCFPSTTIPTTPAFAPSPLGSGYLVSPMDMIQVGTQIWSYYQLYQYDSSATFGVVSAGFGIAPWDAAMGQFAPTSSVLWAGGAPSYGSAAVVSGSSVYVYGCQQTDGSSACYVAQGSAATPDDLSTYQYATNVGMFSPTQSDAVPLVDGANSLNVRLHSSGEWLFTYAPPLGGGFQIQSALGPTGPFSAVYDLFTCDLTGSDFCVGGQQHPEIDPNANTIAVSYGAASFSAEASGSRYWPRLAFVPLPAGLP